MAREAEGTPPGGVFSHYALYRSLQAAAPRRLPVVAAGPEQGVAGAAATTSGAGQRATVWFLGDPRRTDLDAVRSAAACRRPRGIPGTWPNGPEIGGARPIGAEWYRLSPPDWMAGEGWSLTPEAGGRVRAEGSGLNPGPSRPWSAGSPGPSWWSWAGVIWALPAIPATELTLELDGPVVDTWTHDHRTAGPGFLHFLRLAGGMPAGPGAYATPPAGRASRRRRPGRRAGDPPVRPPPGVGIAAGVRPGLARGRIRPGHRAALAVDERAIRLFVVAGSDATLVLRGESPLKYFGEPPTVRVTAGARHLGEFRPDADFEWRIPIPRGTMPRGGGVVTVSTRSRVPARSCGRHRPILAGSAFASSVRRSKSEVIA